MADVGNKRCINAKVDGERCTDKMGLKSQCYYHYNYKLSSKGGARTLTQSQVENVIELYSSGLSANQVAEKTRVSKPTVLRYARLKGINRTSEIGQGSKYSDNRRKPTHKSYLNDKLSKVLSTAEYKLFRRRMLERDKWTCVQCGYKGSKIHLDHIKPRCYYPELTFNEDNVRTLCVSCHKKTDTWGYKAILNKEKIML